MQTILVGVCMQREFEKTMLIVIKKERERGEGGIGGRGGDRERGKLSGLEKASEFVLNPKRS